jgi:hypothetical protein
MSDLEERSLWLVKASVLASGLLLAAGLLLHVTAGGHPGGWPPRLLAIGLMILMAVPALRVVIATAERIRRRAATGISWPRRSSC